MSESIQIVKEFYEALRAGDVNRALPFSLRTSNGPKPKAFPTTAAPGTVRRP
jgi:hypothetical protein